MRAVCCLLDAAIACLDRARAALPSGTGAPMARAAPAAPAVPPPAPTVPVVQPAAPIAQAVPAVPRSAALVVTPRRADAPDMDDVRVTGR